LERRTENEKLSHYPRNSLRIIPPEGAERRRVKGRSSLEERRGAGALIRKTTRREFLRHKSRDSLERGGIFSGGKFFPKKKICQVKKTKGLNYIRPLRFPGRRRRKEVWGGNTKRGFEALLGDGQEPPSYTSGTSLPGINSENNRERESILGRSRVHEPLSRDFY